MERLDALKRLPGNQDPKKQIAIKKMGRLFTSAGLEDLGSKGAVSVSEKPSLRLPEAKSQAKAEILADSKDLQLQSIVKEYSTQPHTPELVTNFWQTFLDVSIKGQGLAIPVPVISCDRILKELEDLKKEGGMWVPETKLTYAQLGQVFPEMQSYTVEKDSPIKDEFAQGAKGVDVEVAIDAPNTNTTEEDLENLFKKQGRKGMRLSTYILTSQASKVSTGKYLDGKTTWSRLLGSRRGGRVVAARFSVNGRLDVGWSLNPKEHYSGWGGRSEGAKKA